MKPADDPHLLEILRHDPPGIANPLPLLFVHGAYTGAWCWEEHFLPFFASRGWTAVALSLSGHGASPGREHLDALSLDDYVADVLRVMETFNAPPVLIGHSMGGMVVQKVLERATVPGAALLCSVPPQGLLGSALRLALAKPNLMQELNRLMGGGQVAMAALNEALFAQPVDADALKRYYRHMQPESHRAIWDMMMFNLPRVHHMDLPPLLVLGAEYDHLIPPTLVEMTARTYHSRAEILPGLGHGLMLEREWQRPALRLLAWLDSL